MFSYDILIVKQCKAKSNFKLPRVALERRRAKFLRKFACVQFFVVTVETNVAYRYRRLLTVLILVFYRCCRSLSYVERRSSTGKGLTFLGHPVCVHRNAHARFGAFAANTINGKCFADSRVDSEDLIEAAISNSVQCQRRFGSPE